MGTRWRGLLAPINVSTGDRRRIADGALTWRELPIALKWQRTDQMGHDDSVAIGSADSLNIGTVAEAVANGWISADVVGQTMSPDTAGLWGAGELFDDVDPAQLPRLAQDVGEAKLLTSKKVIGPSIDPADVTAVLVRPGEDTPLTGDELDQLFMEAMDSGQDPPIEELYTQAQVSAATLVVIPAFEEARPFELLADPTGNPPDAGNAPADTAPAAPAAAPVTSAALVATLTRLDPVIPADVFAAPDPDVAYQPLVTVDRGEGFRRVFGHIAPAGTCHLEFRDVCYTPPLSALDYVPFHRYPVQLADGQLIGAGRLTTGFGKVGTGCGHEACRMGKYDHACTTLGLGQTIAHYDQLTTLAYVRATDTAGGPWISGYVLPGLDKAGLRMLAGERVKVSGDWREHAGNLELIEVLALSGGAREGFPPPRVSVRSGRRFALTAGWGGPSPALADADPIDYRRLAETMASVLSARGLLAAQPAQDQGVQDQADDAEAPPEHTGAMVALRMSDEDAQRLAVQGGEPAEELHLTIAYLGEAADWPADAQAALTEAMQPVANALVPFDADPSSITVFNADQEEPCLVLGCGGQPLMDAVTTAVGALQPFGEMMPEPHVPYIPHVTLIYGGDPRRQDTVAKRLGTPIRFDRLRVAFAGVNVDLPLGGEPPDPAQQAAALAAEVDLAIEAEMADERARQAARLMAEMEGLHVLRI